MQIVDVIFAHGQGAFYNDDQAAVKNGAARDGFFYTGQPLTPGFPEIRAPAAVLGIGLVLGNGLVSWGDMMTVQYAAAGGRERHGRRGARAQRPGRGGNAGRSRPVEQREIRR